MSKVEEAVKLYNEGMSCSQAVLVAYCEEYGLNKILALKLAVPFSKGMARMGQTCGAITGAYMVIGLKYSKNKDAKEKVFAAVKCFTEEFKRRNRSTLCHELLKLHASNPESKQSAQERGVKSICEKFVRDAAEILEGMTE